MRDADRHTVSPARLIAAGLALSCLASFPALAHRTRPRIIEKGYRVTYHEACGSLGVDRIVRQTYKYWVQPSINDIECSPGGPWGDYVYLLVTEQDVAAGIWIDLERVTFEGESEFFWSVEPFDTGTFLSFAPVGWREGETAFVTVGDSGGGFLIKWLRLGGGSFPTLTFGQSLGPTAVDPGGDFAGDLFYAEGGDIIRVDSSGTETLFATPPRIGSEMRFGPGGPWGTDLYTGGSVISPDGSVAPFPAPFGEFVWTHGPGFDGDMFDLAPGSPHTIERIQPDGTRTVFGTTRAAAHMAFCNGSLWLTGGHGCYVVTPREQPKGRALLKR